MIDDIEPEPSVGYARPPADGQFKAGRSGNTSGRPKGARNKATILQDIASEEHRVTAGGSRRYVTTVDLLFMRLRELALKGDERALDAFNAWNTKLDQETEAEWTVGLRVGEGYYGPEDSPLKVESVEDDHLTEGP